MSVVGRRERARKAERHRRLVGAPEPEPPAEQIVGVRSQGSRAADWPATPADPSAWLRERARRIRGL